MSKIDKLIERLRRQTEADIADIETLMAAFGYGMRPGKGSHRVYSKPGSRFTIPTRGGRKVKRAYINELFKLLDL